MTKVKLVNLLDDFALGGVSRGLGIFESEPVKSVAICTVQAIAANATLAPRIDADIVVTHFPPNWRRLVFLASLRLRNPQARIVHIEHSYTKAWEAAHAPSRSRFRAMLRLAMTCVDRLVCVSQAQARWAQDAAHIPRDKISVIYPYATNTGLNALPLPDFIQGKTLRVGAYGRFDHAKGFDRLIKAYVGGAMPGTVLTIGGFGEEEQRLRDLAQGVSGIHFAGKVTDVSAFLAECDIVAVPSRRESYGQVANEAREAGRPIFVSNVDGLPEQVGNAGMIVDYDSLGEVRQIFASLCTSKLQNMAKAARAETKDCGLQRQQQWADLITELGPDPRGC